MNKDFVIGQSAKDNWKILSEAKQNYIWFHLDDYPSPYVILHKTFTESLKSEIKEAAIACKENSKYKNLPSISVIYCEVKNLRKGSKVGQVIIKSNKKCKKLVI